MDEMGWQSSSVNDMKHAFTIGGRIVTDLRNMMPSAWLYWQTMEAPNVWGLLGVPLRYDANLNEVTYSSGFYGMMQFSKYIKQGSSIIFNNDLNSVTAFHKASNSLTIVIMHDEDSTATKAFDLQLFSGQKMISSATRTSPNSQNQDVTNDGSVLIMSGDILQITLPPKSITTVVVSGIGIGSDVGENLLQNPDFEESGGWEVSSWGNVGSTDFPWRGQKHGYLPSWIFWQENWIQQSAMLTIDSQFYLSLFASTSGSHTFIEAIVNNNRVAQVQLDSRQGYRLYGLSFTARKNDVLVIKIRSGSGDGPVYVDNTRLHWGNVRQ